MTTSQQRTADAQADAVGPAGPVATIRGCVAALAVLALVLGLLADDVGTALAAYGVIGLVPIALGAGVRGFTRRPAVAADRREDAAIVLAAAALCWQPVVLITGLREQIFAAGPLATVAGVAALVLSLICARSSSCYRT